MGKVVVMDHPLIQHKIGIMRRTDTGSKDFRTLVSEVAMLECYEATRDLELTDVEIETPICKATVKELKGKKLAVVPILRAGLGMVEGMLELIPAAKVGHIGMYRDPETAEPIEYYCKLPADCANREVFVVDPMLATGGSAVAALDMLKKLNTGDDEMEGLASIPRQIEGVLIGITMREKEGGFFKISVRTNNNINASDFCSQFGGGGHPAAAGCSIEGDLETVKTTLEKAAEKFLS